MATERHYCCGEPSHREGAGLLFDVLRDLADGKSKLCGACGKPCRLELTFDHGLGIGSRRCIALAAYHPSQAEEWDDGAAKVRFYPFLVVLESDEEPHRAVWLPYWHVVNDGGRRTTKYGQWAPFLGQDIFSDLVRQAKEDGYLKSV